MCTVSEIWPLRKLRPNRCRWRHGYYCQPIGSRQRTIRWYQRRPFAIYRLATICPWLTLDRPPFSETKRPAVARIADRTNCQWFWPYPRCGRLELETAENCGQTAADVDMVTTDKWQPIGSRQRPIRWHHCRPVTTYRLATIHSWSTDDRPPFSETKNPAVARIAHCTGCQWFWPYPRYGRLELETAENCGQTVADGDMVTTNNLGSRQRPIWWHHRWPATTYRLTTIQPW